MIHLVAIQTSLGVWTITTSDMVTKVFGQERIIREWKEYKRRRHISDELDREGDNATK